MRLTTPTTTRRHQQRLPRPRPPPVLPAAVPSSPATHAVDHPKEVGGTRCERGRHGLVHGDTRYTRVPAPHACPAPRRATTTNGSVAPGYLPTLQLPPHQAIRVAASVAPRTPSVCPRYRWTRSDVAPDRWPRTRPSTSRGRRTEYPTSERERYVAAWHEREGAERPSHCRLVHAVKIVQHRASRASRGLARREEQGVAVSPGDRQRRETQREIPTAST